MSKNLIPDYTTLNFKAADEDCLPGSDFIYRRNWQLVLSAGLPMFNISFSELADCQK